MNGTTGSVATCPLGEVSSWRRYFFRCAESEGRSCRSCKLPPQPRRWPIHRDRRRPRQTIVETLESLDALGDVNVAVHGAPLLILVSIWVSPFLSAPQQRKWRREWDSKTRYNVQHAGPAMTNNTTESYSKNANRAQTERSARPVLIVLGLPRLNRDGQ